MSLCRQERYYLTQEADDYFQRNVTTEASPPEYIRVRIDQFLRILSQNDVRPKRVLEIGPSGGLLLSEIHDRYGADYLGIEPSAKAVEFARGAHDGIEMRQGVASDLTEERNGQFDLVMVKGVFCWIGREELLRSIAEIDRVLADGGYLLVSDYLPEYATKNRNAHVKDEEIYCYKTDHAKIVLDTHLYALVGAETYFDRGEIFRGRFDDTRNRTTLLRKSYGDYYVTGNP